PNDNSTLGDETLIGTHLQLITDFGGPTPTFKFQLTSAIGLGGQSPEDIDSALQDTTSEAVTGVFGDDTRSGDSRFAAVLKAALAPDPVAKQDPQSEGTGGLPNLRVMSDFGKVRSRTFEIHTVVEIDPADVAALTTAIQNRKHADAMAILRTNPL